MERRNGIRIIVAVFAVVTGIGPVVASQYGGGAGTRTNPYLIRTAQQLSRLGDDPNDWDMHFKLMTDLDLRQYDLKFSVIGTQDKPFTGSFDGNGHRILNFSCTVADGNNIGFFGYVDEQTSGGICGLELVDPVIQAGGSDHVGAMVGWLSHGTVTGCRVTGGTVTGKINTGGLVGLAGSRDAEDHPTSKASLTGSFTSTTVHGETAVGGLLGRHWVGMVIDCSAEGQTTGENEVGGLIGRNNDTVMECSGSGHTTGQMCVGGLAGLSTGPIMHCRAQGDVFGSNQYVGGLVGSNEGGTVADSYSIAKVQGFIEVGGLVGYHDGTIARCWTSNEVVGDIQIGGLAGSHNVGTITACYTTGTVTGQTIVGGLVGCNWGTIQQCYSTAQVTGATTTAGGLVGTNWRVVQQSYSTGQVTSVKTAGGLVGQNAATITQCYAAGLVQADQEAGGLVGFAGQHSEVDLCFWDTQASGQSASAAGIAKTTVQMKTASTFAGWAPSSVWTVQDGKDYPRLAWQTTAGEFIALPTYGGGSGTEGAPYEIRTPEHLVILSMSPNQWNKHFRLRGSIDLTAWPETMEPIGNEVTHFSGTFNGDGGSLLGYSCTSTRERYVGLFGYVERGARITKLRLIAPHVDAAKAYGVGALVGFLGSGAEVTDCHCVDADISGDASVGGLVGNNAGTVNGCSTTGVVNGLRTVGGLAGYNQELIARCFSQADTTASDATIAVAGGLVGENYATIRDSYATGNVVGSRRLGGLAGRNEGSIRGCYSTGLITGPAEVGGLIGSQTAGHVYASFWDVQTSGCATSAGGAGKTTAELQRSETFVGWVEDGIWTLAQGQDYPRLAWENAPGEPLYGPQPLGSFAGDGTAESPYLIGTTEDLSRVGSFPSEWHKHFRLTADLDLSESGGTAFNLIGNPTMPFSGTFDGDGHTISNFSYVSERRDYLGLFVVVDGESACIRNLTLVNPSVKGFAYVAPLVGELRRGRIIRCSVQNATVFAEHCAGGLVSDSKGNIHQCFVTGSVTTQVEDAGGLVGRNYGAVSQSFAAVRCQGLGYTKGTKHLESAGVGGLVGHSEGTISDCYATGSAQAEVCAGGLVGYNRTKTIINCYSTGIVSGRSRIGGLVGGNGGTVRNSFWNTQTSRQAISAGGSSQSTGEMKQISLYLAAGWDFDGETANGTEDVWTIREGQDYPRLAWESAAVAEEDQ